MNLLEIRNWKLVIALVIFMLLFTSVAPAQAAIVTCGLSSQDNPATPEVEGACTLCDILQLIKRIIDYIFVPLTPIIAGLFILLSGFYIVLGGANPEMIGKGKQMLTTTLIGVAIIYGSWMVTNFVLVSLAGENPSIKTWFKIGTLDCAQDKSGAGDTKPGPGGTGTGVLPNDGKTRLTDVDARKALAPGVTVKDGASLEGINQSTIDEANALQRQCNCQVVITEGTGGTHETGLFSHGNGYKVDIRSKTDSGSPSGVTKAILDPNGDFKYVRSRSNGDPVYQNTKTGAEYALEERGTKDEHWDVLVK